MKIGDALELEARSPARAPASGSGSGSCSTVPAMVAAAGLRPRRPAQRVVAAPGREVDQRADDARDDEERDEREHVARVGDRERVDRRREEPVEQQERARSTPQSPGRAPPMVAIATTNKQVDEQRVLQAERVADGRQSQREERAARRSSATSAIPVGVRDSGARCNRRRT